MSRMPPSWDQELAQYERQYERLISACIVISKVLAVIALAAVTIYLGAIT